MVKVTPNPVMAPATPNMTICFLGDICFFLRTHFYIASQKPNSDWIQPIDLIRLNEETIAPWMRHGRLTREQYLHTYSDKPLFINSLDGCDKTVTGSKADKREVTNRTEQLF
jgi:hypothetical protein